jgi:hypothetical protein
MGRRRLPACARLAASWPNALAGWCRKSCQGSRPSISTGPCSNSPSTTVLCPATLKRDGIEERRLGCEAVRVGHIAVPCEAKQDFPHLFGRGNVISYARCDGAARHPVKLRGRRVLHYRLPLALAEIGVGAELVPPENEYLRHSVDLKNTVRDPDYVTARASQERLELAEGANALDAALDAADTINLQNSVLAHQMAVLHRAVMKLAQRFDEQVDRLHGTIDRDAFQRFNVEMCRTAGTLARMAGVRTH